jgi:hypothetical protein
VASHGRARKAAYPGMMFVLVSALAGTLVAGLFLVADGKSLTYFYEENRVPVSLDDIAPVHVPSFTASARPLTSRTPTALG